MIVVGEPKPKLRTAVWSLPAQATLAQASARLGPVPLRLIRNEVAFRVIRTDALVPTVIGLALDQMEETLDREGP